MERETGWSLAYPDRIPVPQKIERIGLIGKQYPAARAHVTNKIRMCLKTLLLVEPAVLIALREGVVGIAEIGSAAACQIECLAIYGQRVGTVKQAVTVQHALLTVAYEAGR